MNNNKNKITLNTTVTAGPDADPVILFHMMTYYKNSMEKAQEEAKKAQEELHLMSQHAREWKRLQGETYEDLLHTRMIRDQERALRTRAERSLQIAQNTIRFLDTLLDERLEVGDLVGAENLMSISTDTESTIDLTTDEEMTQVIDLTMESEDEEEDEYIYTQGGVFRA